MRSSTTLVCSLLLIGSGFALPQDPKARPLVIAAGEHMLPGFIAAAAKALDWTILCSPQEVSQVPDQRIGLQHAFELDREGYEQVFGLLLYAKGFGLVPLDRERRIWEAFYLNGPKRALFQAHAKVLSPDALEKHAKSWYPVLVHVPLQHLNAVKVCDRLNELLSREVKLTAAGDDSRQIVVSGAALCVAPIVELLARLDVPAEIGAAGAPDLTWPGRVERRLEQLEARVAALQKR